MPETEAEVTEVTGEHDDYLTYDFTYINEKLLDIDNKLSDISAKNDKYLEDFKELMFEAKTANETLVTVSDNLSAGYSDDVAFHGVLSLMLGALLGLLIVFGWCGRL